MSELDNIRIQVLGDKDSYTKEEVMILMRVLASEKDWEYHPENPFRKTEQ